MYLNFKSLFYSRFLGLFHTKFPKKVSYSGFSEKNDDAFNDFLNIRLNNPAKIRALDWLAKEQLFNEKFSILDCGCGPGVIPQLILQSADLKNRVEYTGVDVSENALRYCRSRLPADYVLVCRDLLNDGLPEGDFDVIMINEVLEHLPSYKKLIAAALAKEPRIFIITTFAVLHGPTRDRILWNTKKQCYMNSYSFEKFFKYLRDKVSCPILVCDVDRQTYNRYWFPRKELMIWYMRLESPGPGYLKKK